MCLRCHASTRCLFCPITLQAQPNQQATTAEFEAWASSVGLRVELCSHARGTLRQLGYLAPPARIPKDRSYLWSLVSTSSSSGGAGSSSGSPAGSSCSSMAGAGVPATSASLSSGGASSPAASSASTGEKPSQQPLQPAQHLPAGASVPKPKQMQQRRQAAGAVPKPKLPRRHRLAVEGAREPQLHRQEVPVAPIHTTAGGAASRGTSDPASPVGKLLVDERAKPSPPASTAEPPGPVGPVSAGARQPGPGAQCQSVASRSAAAGAPAAAPGAQPPSGAVLPSAKQGQSPAVHAVVPAGTNTGAATAQAGGVPAKAPEKAAKRKPRPAGNRNRQKRVAWVRRAGVIVGALLIYSMVPCQHGTRQLCRQARARWLALLVNNEALNTLHRIHAAGERERRGGQGAGGGGHRAQH